MSVPSTREPPSKNATADIPLLEWVIGVVGLAIIVGVVSVLIYEAIADDKSPPDVKLTAQSIAPLQNGFLVKVRAENMGGEPAARVSITAEVWEQSKVVESSETQFEHLPPKSSREAGASSFNATRGPTKSASERSATNRRNLCQLSAVPCGWKYRPRFAETYPLSMTRGGE